MNPPEDKPKLRVSDWGDADGSTPPAPVTSTPPLASTSNPATPAEPTAESEGLDLPVDPFRLLGGVWKRRIWLVLGAIAGAILLTVAGIFHTQTRFQVSAQLIKREVPNSFRAGEIGEAFKPRELSTATLIGLAGSMNVLQRVAERADPPISLSALRRNIEVAEQRGTDYLYLTLSGYTSAADTVTLANIWAEEVVAYSREMQSRESREIRQYLQQELDANQTELERTSQGLLEYTQREGLVSVDKQIDAKLRAIGALDLQFEGARLEVKSIDVKLRSLELELARQSPLADELKDAQAALAAVKTRYTDSNPLTLEAQDRVDNLVARLAEDRASNEGDLSRFAGTFLGNTLYLQILDLRSQREALFGNLEQLEQLRDNAQKELNELPAKELGIAQLSRTRASLESTRDLLLSRSREAEVFEERPPGYYQLFSPATLDTVITRAKMLKVAVYGGAGLVLGFGGVFLLVLGLELLDSKLRTGAEAARAWGTPLLACVPILEEEDTDATRDIITRLWTRWLGDARSSQVPRVIWAPKPHASEEMLWRGLVTEAQRLLPDLIIIDAGNAQAVPPSLGALPRAELEDALNENAKMVRVPVTGETLTLDEANTLAARLRQAATSGRPIWLRLAGSVHEPLSTLSRASPSPLIAVSAGVDTIPNWREQAARFRATVGSPGGVVVIGEVPWHAR